MKRKWITILIVAFQLAIFLSLSSTAGIIKDTPADLLSEADRLLWQQLKTSFFQKQGFHPYIQPDEIKLGIRLGKPCPKYAVKLEKIFTVIDQNDLMEALTFKLWSIPIYIGDEKEPRVYAWMRKVEDYPDLAKLLKDDEQWSLQVGGSHKQISEVRKRYPASEGYNHAIVGLGYTYGDIMMVEKSNTVQFYIFSEKTYLAEKYKISKNSEGYYPLISLDHFIKTGIFSAE